MSGKFIGKITTIAFAALAAGMLPRPSMAQQTQVADYPAVAKSIENCLNRETPGGWKVGYLRSPATLTFASRELPQGTTLTVVKGELFRTLYGSRYRERINLSKAQNDITFLIPEGNQMYDASAKGADPLDALPYMPIATLVSAQLAWEKCAR
jgi:hypothetical protein